MWYNQLFISKLYHYPLTFFTSLHSSSRSPHSQEMKPIFNTLVALLVLFSASLLNAQTLTISFSPAAPSGTVGSNITVDVIANDFTNIAGMQFPILFDKTKLEFQSANTLTPDLPNFIYGTPPNPSSIANPVGTNKVSVVWFDPSGAPNFLAPNAILFKMVFKVLVAGTSNIYIGNAPPPSINVFGEGNVPAIFTYPTGPPVLNGFALVMPTEEVQPGDTVCLPVTVNDFTNVVGMQFMVNWNSNMFTFSHVQNFGINYFDCTKFNPGTLGRLAVNWEDITGIGTTVANGSAIFEVCLIANGANAAAGGVSNVRCDGAGMPPSSPIAIENNTGANVWSNASSSIAGPVTVNANATPDDKIVRFIADTSTVAQVGNNAVVNIKVKNFKNLNSFQFVLMYDPLVLGTTLPTFTTILPNGTLPLPATGPQMKVEQVAGQPGKLKISWRSLSASSGQTIADGTSIITLTFPTNTASPGASTRLMIGGLTNPVIPMQVSERNFTCTFMPRSNDGFVKISASSPNATVTLVSKTDVNCFGNNNGSIDINVVGGTTTTYTYLWSRVPAGFSATTQDITNLAPGTYQVTVTAGTQMVSLATPVVIAGPIAPISIPTSGAGALVIQAVKCFNGSDGNISINPVGGTAPYTYLWTGGITTQNLTSRPGGTYTVTITDSKGCTTVSAGYNIATPANPLLITASQSQIKDVRCFGESNGSVTTAVANANGTPNFVWFRVSPAPSVQVSSAQSPNNFGAGTYTVTVTDGNQCTAVLSQVVTINNPPSAFSLPAPTTTQPACEGQNNGSICLSPTGGWGNYSYQWSTPSPGMGPCPSGVGAGTYSVTVTDANGCASATSTTLISTSVAPSVTNLMKTDITCFNAGNGSITISLNAPFSSINWTGPAGPAGSGTTISNLSGGDYMATLNYGTGCSKPYGPVTIVNPAPITVTVVGTTQQNGPTGGSIDISATGGTGLLSYTWTAPGFTSSVQDPTNLQPGTYTLIVRDANNCSTPPQTIEITSACVVCGTSYTTVKSCGDDGCINAIVPSTAQGPFVLSWVGPEVGSQAFSQGVFELSVCNLKPGAYGVTVTDANNQSFPSSLIIEARPGVQITSNTVNSTQANKNGSININISPGLPLTHMWISGNIPVPPNNLNSPVIFQLDSGTYCVKVTNLLPEGCEEVYCFDLVREYPNLICGSPVVTSPNCLSTANGSITLSPTGGNNSFTYSWAGSNGFTATTKNIINLGPGTYTCTVTSGDGQICVVTPSTLTPLSTLAVSNVNEVSDFNGYQVSGVGICNGVANVVTAGASGTVSYLWSNGITTASNTSLCGGVYSLIVTDQTGCTASWTNELTSPAAVVATVTAGVEYNGYGVSCNGACDAIARISVAGGVVPYVVKWPGGKTELLINSASFALQSDICAGIQTVVITDANGNVTNFPFPITEPDPITLTFTDIEPLNLATCNAEIIPEATGTVGDVTYQWQSQFHQGNGLRADGLCADEVVTFKVTDGNGCTATAQHTAPFPTDECFNVNPVLTPNGDGDNDYFEILCLQNYPNTVEIYDRWNQAVTTKITNYANNWDGKRGGVPVPEGVYFYVVSFVNDLGQPITLKGYFNILH
jgi:gliding motility-associated-like protein